MEVVFLLILVALVAWFVSRPLRGGGGGAEAADAENPRIAELEARKEAKYREIRDAELDRAAGKLSEVDFRVQDAELRREAIEILREMDRVAGGGGRAGIDEAGSGDPERIASGEPDRPDSPGR